MDPALPKLLQFDRFALDLTRERLRAGDQEIALRPKAFEVLRHLAENAGRLVSKRELFEVVWPNVAVTDDSLVQCIRELRDKLGDTDHLLIETVPRRGYLLNVGHPRAAKEHDSLPPPERSQTPIVGSPGRRLVLWSPVQRKRASLATAAITICCLAAAGYLTAHLWLPSSANALFTEDDARRITAIAAEKELPLPPFQISRIGRGVLPEHRRFVGIWVSSTGFVNSNRQFMLVITGAEPSGIVTGFTVRGPPRALSLVVKPAGATHFKARVLGDSFRYSGPNSEREVVMTADRRLEFNEVFDTGVIVRVALDPVWALVEAEQKAALW
ncbi:winged helix-turn-helix domain-containing protein [Bosea sp. Root670]|uniref:winged helix-turn-helix domain-containing protein n=1 Tax=Bosea sp. Root670 TaxID=1736583 RepID=UPI0009E6B90D|nr:winged helix-turn-helix domain-containing protein [Bosea sp. Root670]